MLKKSIVLPREKMELYGVKSLQICELIAIILGSGSKYKDVLTLSKEVETLFLHSEHQSVFEVEVKKIVGIGRVNALKLIALYELTMTLQVETLAQQTEQVVIQTPEDVVKYFQHLLNVSKQEILIGVYLDTQNKVVACEKLFTGTIDSVEIHPREIFLHALMRGAKSIILMHNHPSGNSTPSQADISTTKRLAEIGHSLGVPIIDHIIVVKNNFKSLKREAYF